MGLLYWVFQNIFIILLYPLANWLLPLFIPFISNRIKFEKKNTFDPFSRSFKDENIMAQVTLEISSEGELEQIRPLLDYFLKNNLYIELIFCSPSVEPAIINLAKKNPLHLRILRLPLITYFPFLKNRSIKSWMTSSKIILCRYDFFPELLLLGRKDNITFILVSATLKGQKMSSFLKRKFLSFIYNSFDIIVSPTEEDKNKFIKYFNLKCNFFVIEFRVIQINNRVTNSKKMFNNHPFLKEFINYLNNFERKNRIILGSFWDTEAQIINNQDFIKKISGGEVNLTIIPHQLNQKNAIETALNKATSQQIPLYFFDPSDNSSSLKTLKEKPGIVILLFRGILCELYSFYQHAFVGGGHGRSIHSVLEPYLANGRVYVGPRVFRSTEYDFVKNYSADCIHIVHNLTDFWSICQLHMRRPIDYLVRQEIVEKSLPKFQEFRKII